MKNPTVYLNFPAIKFHFRWPLALAIWVFGFGLHTHAQGNAVTTLSVGNKPHFCCFDGQNVWVNDDATGVDVVYKIRVSDNTILGTYKTGVHPGGMAFDGANIWCTNQTDGTITKIRASDGAILGTFKMGAKPSAVCCDGTSIWVCLSNSPASLLQVNPSTGAIINTYTTGLGNAPKGICFDGTNLWLTQYKDGTLAKVRASDGTVLGTFATQAHPEGICFDGTNIWVCNVNSSTVQKFLAGTGALIGTYATGSAPIECCFDRHNIWVTCNVKGGTPGLYKFDAATGRELGNYIVGTASYGIAFDGTSVWVCNNNNAAGAGTVSRVSVTAPADSGRAKLAANQVWEINVNTGMTDEGRKLTPPTTDHPVYYCPSFIGFRVIGSTASKVKPPSKGFLQQHLIDALASQGYLTSHVEGTALSPAPSFIIIFRWGDIKPVMYVEPGSGGVVNVYDPKAEKHAQHLVGGEDVNVIDDAWREEVLNAAEDERYYVTIAAYDFLAYARDHKKILLWVTRMSIPRQDLELDQVILPLITAGTPLLGRETTRPRLVTLGPNGNVEVGPTEVKGVVAPAAAQPPATTTPPAPPPKP
jgi:hypothetical protein